jgi:hypothetical protein
VTDVTSQTLRVLRESKGWDVPRMARELRKAARDTGEDTRQPRPPASGTGCCT